MNQKHVISSYIAQLRLDARRTPASVRPAARRRRSRASTGLGDAVVMAAASQAAAGTERLAA